MLELCLYWEAAEWSIMSISLDSCVFLIYLVTGLSALDLHARKLGITFEDMHPLEVRSR